MTIDRADTGLRFSVPALGDDESRELARFYDESEARETPSF
ncbi:MAG TPA: hypothetical protein VNW96_00640 [Mycobacterium sp.]|nr:hypothetical protein [Mycobacterium sp.]